MIGKYVFAAIAAGGLASSAFGGAFFDDLTDGLFDPVFNYDFQAADDFTGVADFNGVTPQGLWVYPDEVIITFPGLPAGELVELAHIEIADYVGIGALSVEFFGTLGSVKYSNLLTSTIETYQVDQSNGIGYITSIEVGGYEDVISLVSLRTVPTPGAPALAALVGIAALRRRR